MKDESKLYRDKERGVQADALMRNEMLKEAFKTLEAEYVKAWASTHSQEGEARENYWRALQILGNVEQHLKSVSAHGRLAEKELFDLANKFRSRAA